MHETRHEYTSTVHQGGCIVKEVDGTSAHRPTRPCPHDKGCTEPSGQGWIVGAVAPNRIAHWACGGGLRARARRGDRATPGPENGPLPH